MTTAPASLSTAVSATSPLAGLKVLVIAPFPYGIDRGTPIRARRGVELARRAGADVTVVTYGANLPTDPGVVRGFRRVRSTRQGFSTEKPILDLILTFDAIRLARRLRPDVLHAHVHEGLAIALVTRLFARNSRIVYDAHGTLADELVHANVVPRAGSRYRVARRIERWLVRRADAVVAQSRHRAKDLMSDGVRPDRVVVLPDGPEATFFDVGRIRCAELAAAAGQTVAIYSGSLERYQGIDEIIAAAELTTGIRFVLFGEPGEEYVARVRARGLSDRVEVIDPAPFAALPGLLSRADVALAPRHYGGNIPGKVPAYLAAGLPVVGTDVEGIREMVDDSVGAIVPPGDAPALAAALQRLADDPAGLRDRGVKAYERALETYGETAMLGSLRTAYGGNA